MPGSHPDRAVFRHGHRGGPRRHGRARLSAEPAGRRGSFRHLRPAGRPAANPRQLHPRVAVPGRCARATRHGNCLAAATPSPYWRASLETDARPSPASNRVLPAGVVVRASRSPLRFSPDALGASTGTLTICDVHGVAPPRAIVLSLSGRARLATASRRGNVDDPDAARLHAGRNPGRAGGALGRACSARPRCCSTACAPMPARCAGLPPRSLVRDMADRIRANPRGGVYYDARTPAPGASAAPACVESSGCDIAQLAAADRAHFESAAHALFPHPDTDASVEYAPAIGPAAPDRYVITLRWRDARDDAGHRHCRACRCWRRRRWRAERASSVARRRLQSAGTHDRAGARLVRWWLHFCSCCNVAVPPSPPMKASRDCRMSRVTRSRCWSRHRTCRVLRVQPWARRPAHRQPSRGCRCLRRGFRRVVVGVPCTGLGQHLSPRHGRARLRAHRRPRAGRAQEPTR